MTTIDKLENVVALLKNGDLTCLTNEIIKMINNEALRILATKDSHLQKDIIIMNLIILISNILYNNTDKDVLPLEDGVFDLLYEEYKKYNPDYQVGAPPIQFKSSNEYRMEQQKKTVVPGIVYYDTEETKDFLFKEELYKWKPLTTNDFITSGIIYDTSARNTVRDTAHDYPELVGTLDKCKFILSSEAEERGVLNDSNVKILERDFFAKHLRDGIIRPDQKFGMVLELKYDGISVETTIAGNRILSARTRGDANADLASDITHILKNYRFPDASNINPNDIFGMKWEAIITYDNLWRYNQVRGKEYKNPRTAVSSIFSSLDGEDFVDYITLVPLATSLDDIDRITEIAFMNTYYAKDEYLRYAVIYGDYKECLFQIKKFVEEAEFMRNKLNFLYDGVVVSYLDDDIRQKLGRQNSVNLYSMAVKFNALSKQTKFLGYSYSVGQDGSITPMIHFNPVEFLGTIHDKAPGHSYERFKQLSLREGDIITVTYVNDVICYVTKDESINAYNSNPVIPFIDKCPSCGSPLEISKTGKTVFCKNLGCPDRNISRMVGMLKKLNLRDFAEESLSKVGIFSFKELMELKQSDISYLGDINSKKLIDQLNKLKTDPIYDYKILGSLGFTGLAIEKWKLILSKYTLGELLSMDYDQLRSILTQIKGIGQNTVDTIISEMDFYRKDLDYIMSMDNIMISKNAGFNGKIIRCTGFRDKELMKALTDLGHDASDGNVTKATDILLIPHQGFTSSKTSRCGENTLIVPVDEFRANMNRYLAM